MLQALTEKEQSETPQLADKSLPLSAKMKLIVQRGGFLLTLLSAVLPNLVNPIFRPRDK